MHSLGQVMGLAADGWHRLHSVDIPYSSHASVQQRLRAMGVTNIQTHSYSLSQPYDAYQPGRVGELLHRVLTSSTGPVVVVDNGAYAVSAMANMPKSLYAGRVAVVEQTARGIIKMREQPALGELVAAAVPVVNVEEADTKKHVESPFIAMNAVERPGWGLRLEDSRVLVNGYGAIGAAVAAVLADGLWGVE